MGSSAMKFPVWTYSLRVKTEDEMRQERFLFHGNIYKKDVTPRVVD